MSVFAGLDMTYQALWLALRDFYNMYNGWCFITPSSCLPTLDKHDNYELSTDYLVSKALSIL